MNLHVTIKITNPEILAKGAQEITEIDTDGMFIASNGLDGQKGAGMVMIGEIEPQHVARAIDQSPVGAEVTAMMVSRVFAQAVVVNRPGQTLRDVLDKMKLDMGKGCECESCDKEECPSRPSQAKTGCDACDDRDEPDKPGCGDPTCPHDPLYASGEDRPTPKQAEPSTDKKVVIFPGHD